MADQKDGGDDGAGGAGRPETRIIRAKPAPRRKAGRPAKSAAALKPITASAKTTADTPRKTSSSARKSTASAKSSTKSDRSSTKSEKTQRNPTAVRASAPKASVRTHTSGSEAATTEAKVGKSTTGKSAVKAARKVLKNVAKQAVAESKSKRKGKGKEKDKKAAKEARRNALSFLSGLKLPSLSLPTPEIGKDLGKGVSKSAREIGGQVLTALNTPAGRVVAAEVLLFLAGSLSKKAIKSPAGQEVASSVKGAVAKAMEVGSEVVAGSAEAASRRAGTAKDVAQDVAGVALTAVTGVVANAVDKTLRGRGKAEKAVADTVEKVAPKASPAVAAALSSSTATAPDPETGKASAGKSREPVA